MNFGKVHKHILWFRALPGTFQDTKNRRLPAHPSSLSRRIFPRARKRLSDSGNLLSPRCLLQLPDLPECAIYTPGSQASPGTAAWMSGPQLLSQLCSSSDGHPRGNDTLSGRLPAKTTEPLISISSLPRIFFFFFLRKISLTKKEICGEKRGRLYF